MTKFKLRPRPGDVRRARESGDVDAAFRAGQETAVTRIYITAKTLCPDLAQWIESMRIVPIFEWIDR